jgi:hypothetical protein
MENARRGSILIVTKCRICRVETGDHNVRPRSVPQYYICHMCENFEDLKRRIRLRRLVLNQYGGECVCCEETTYEFLSIDHINGGGTSHKRQIQKHMWQWLKNNNYPKGFQVLCFNCNLAKGFYGYCPHEGISRGIDGILHLRS